MSTLIFRLSRRARERLQRAREYEFFQHPSDPDLFLELDPRNGPETIVVGQDVNKLEIPLAAWRAFNTRVVAKYGT